MKCLGCSKGIIIVNPKESELCCSNCGLVAEQEYDYSMHWYGEEGTSYATTSFTKINKGLGTVDFQHLPRAKGVKDEEQDKIERNFGNAMPALHAIWGFWRVPAYLREECAIQYRKMIRKGVTHGRNSYSMAIALTFLVCERHGLIRNTEEMAKTLNLSHATVEKCLEAIGK